MLVLQAELIYFSIGLPNRSQQAWRTVKKLSSLGKETLSYVKF